MLEYKAVTNPRWLDAAKTKVICEIDFPHLGGVHTFVAVADDFEEHGRQIFAELIAEKYGPIAPYAAPAPASLPAAAAISDVAFYGALAKAGFITQPEALAAVRSGALPAKMAKAVASLPESDRFDAEMYLSGATSIERANPSVGKVLHLAYDMDDAAVLALFRP
jgi:hypothetical protein